MCLLSVDSAEPYPVGQGRDSKSILAVIFRSRVISRYSSQEYKVG